jgi:hypothetical protein
MLAATHDATLLQNAHHGEKVASIWHNVGLEKAEKWDKNERLSSH